MQPWLGAITVGDKRIENRGWPVPAWLIGQEIALHASKNNIDWSAPAMAWTGAGLPPYEGWEPRTDWRSGLLLGAVAAVVTITGCHHASECSLCDPWAAYGQYHWQLAGNVRVLGEPVRCNGARRLWRVPEDIEIAVWTQLENVSAVAGQSETAGRAAAEASQ
jgi:hypothetical protein